MQTEHSIRNLSVSTAKLLSYIFHPVFSPTLGILIILSHPDISLFLISGTQKFLLLSLVFINTALLPSLFSFFLVRFGFISSMEMKNEKERKWPYLITLIFYLLSYFLLLGAHLPEIIYRLQIGGILTVLLTSLINLRWKISAHMAGLGGISALCLNTALALDQQGLWLGTICLLISGIVGSCRLHLGAHTLMQVMAGWLLGFFSLCLST